MGQYLNKFSSAINQKQAQQVLKLLNRKRNSGQIRNVKEFSQQLSALMSELTATTLQPTTKLFLAEANQKTSSEQYNFMLDRVDDDLEAAFAEANNIAIVQNSHEVVIRDIILKNLRAGIAELQAKIDLYELLNSNPDNFDTALFSTFRESRDNRLQSGILANQILFLDPRKPTNTNPMDDAATEIVGERLVLGNSNVSYHNITGIKQLFDFEAPQIELPVQSPHTSLSNIIDNTKGTYWIQSVLFTSQKESVKVKLELNLGISKEFNFIEIEPAISKDMILESIDYIDNSNTTVSLTDSETIFDGPISIRLKKTAAQRIILTFRSEHFKPTQFEYSSTEPLLDQAVNQTIATQSSKIDALSQDLATIIPSQTVRDTIGVTSTTNKQFIGYEFLLGLDNIKIGLAEYLNSSIYLSKPITLSSVGQLGLKTLESRPYNDNGVVKFTDETYTNTNFLYSSIEYWVIKQDYGTDGSLLKTSKFPILPLNVSRVQHERLVLSEKSNILLPNNDIGYTTFFTNRTASEGNIVVYRNGVPLTDETGNIGSTDGWQDVSISLVDNKPNSGVPMRLKIKIVAPLPGDIFTVSYNVLTSSTRTIPSNLSAFTSVGGLQIVDLVGDLSAYADETQLLTVNDPDATNTTKEVKLYLAIVLRQNTAETSISAAVEEYTLMVSKHDVNKYED